MINNKTKVRLRFPKTLNLDHTFTETTNKLLELQGMATLLQVYDMPTALKFYRDILAFEVVSSFGEGDNVDWVLLKHNEVDLMLNTASKATLKKNLN